MRFQGRTASRIGEEGCPGSDRVRFNSDTHDAALRAAGTDRIALDDAVFTAIAPGALAAGAFFLGSQASDADDRIIYDQATGSLYYDPDGTGAAAQVLFAMLSGSPALGGADFLFI